VTHTNKSYTSKSHATDIRSTTHITFGGVEFKVKVPAWAELTESEAALLEANLNNIVEVAYAKSFHPKYEHDCNGCQFLGGFVYDAEYADEDFRKRDADLWFCPKADGVLGGSIIARFSSEGSNYASAPMTVIESSYLPSEEKARKGEGRQSTSAPALCEGYRRLNGLLT